jgi:hypothetical protein
MDQREEAQKKFWIRDPDSLGRAVDHRLIEAAQRIWEEARLRVIRYLAEDTEAPEILEGAVDAASRAMDTPKSIEFFEHYLLTSVTREAIRRRRRNERFVSVERKDLERLAGAVSTDVERQLDDAKLIEIFRACFDARGRAMFDMRVLDLDWRWIAKLTGYASVRSAQTQFSKKYDRALQRFRALHGSRLKPQSSE